MLLSVLVLTVFFGAYAVGHSLLASNPVKNWFRQIFGPQKIERWYRLAYNILATLTLIPIFPMLALLPNKTLYVIPSPWRWLMLIGQLLALMGAAMALWQTGPLRFLGLTPLLVHRPPPPEALTVHGFYAWVRHPLYFFSLLFIWLTPTMSVNLLTFFILITLYFYIGSIYEERRLLAEFGPAYRHYQQRVPRFIPWRRGWPKG